MNGTQPPRSGKYKSESQSLLATGESLSEKGVMFIPSAIKPKLRSR